MSTTKLLTVPHRSAVLDEAHIGDIRGAFGTIRHGDLGPRDGWWARLRTLLAILGPGLIVMVGDNDAGAFSTYTQVGQDYGTTLLWTLLLLVYVNQEMVLRLGRGLPLHSAGSDADQWRRAKRPGRMPPISELPAPHMTPLTRIWIIVLRGYLVIAGGLVLVRIIQLATADQG